METEKIGGPEGFFISTDKALLQIDVVHDYLSNRSYWASGRPLEIMLQAIEGSLCFGVYHEDKQVGFARVITDYALFAYLADVFILEEYRGRGLSLFLLSTIMAHPRLHGLKRWILATSDAHGLYAKFGFHAPEHPDKWMEMVRITD
jgi:GNAT superfamily N-acetyltransferase